jgi:CHAT domain-containing protein/Tfp pilus assembly protein PilF
MERRLEKAAPAVKGDTSTVASFLTSVFLLLAGLLTPGADADSSAQALATEALVDMQQGRLDEAIQGFRTAVALNRKAGDRVQEAACLFLLATAERVRQDFQNSLMNIETAIEVSRAADTPDLEASARTLRAGIYSELGRRGEALADLDAAAALVHPAQRPSSLPVLTLLAQIEIDLGRYSKAATHFEEALRLAQTSGAEESRGWLLAGLGLARTKQGRLEDAVPLLKEALEIARSRRDEKEEASVLAALANLSNGMGDHGAARSYLERAEIIYQKINDASGLWLTRMSLADINFAEGRDIEAVKVYEEARDFFRQVKEDPKLARVVTVLAVFASRHGRSEEALRYHEEALAIHRRTGDRGEEARALNNLAVTEFLLGRPERSLEYLEQALTLQRDGGNSAGEAKVLLDSGHYYTDLGRIEEGLSRFEEALRISRSIGDTEKESFALAYIAQVLFALSDSPTALIKVEEGHRIAQENGHRLAERTVLVAKGLVLLGLKRPRESLESLKQARDLSQALGLPCEEAEVLLAAGAAHLVARQVAEARKAFESARQVQREARCFVSRDLAPFALGFIYESLGQMSLSMDAYRETVEIIESSIENIRTDDLLAGAIHQTALVYPRLLSRLVQSGDAEAAFTVAEQARGRSFLRQLGNRRVDSRDAGSDLIAQEQSLRTKLEELKQQVQDEHKKPFYEKDQALLSRLAAEIDDGRKRYETLLIRLKQSKPEYASLVHASPLSIGAVQQLLDRETTLVEYFVLDGEILAWVIDQGTHHLIRLPVAKENLQGKIELLRNRIVHREPVDDLASELYQTLFAPLALHVRHPNLLIIPHDALHFLPFAVLANPHGRPLVESYTLAYLPSASVLPFVLGKRKPVAGPMLALGNPDESLPHAAAEALAAARFYGAEPLLGAHATETALRERASRTGILHIAAHAVRNSARPLFSHLVLARDAQNDGDLEIHEIFDLDLSRATLVVLSGCTTSYIGVTTGDDLAGLPRAFLYAGTPAVVTTFWVIDDQASMELTRSFYRHLLEGNTVAAALRKAQLEIRRQKRWALPYYWAAFGLIGLAKTSSGLSVKTGV